MKYYVYILKSVKDNKYYIGSTSNIEARLVFHNAGLQRSTKSCIPFVFIYSEEYEAKKMALKRERQIKDYKGGQGFLKFIGK